MLSVFACTKLKAQTVDELAAKYPNAYAVMLTHNRNLKITLENNAPYAEIQEQIVMAVLDDKANGSYNRYKVYHGTFNEIKDIEAYTKVPDGNGFKKLKVTDMHTESAASEGVFYDDVKATSFDFPSISKGALAYVNYTETFSDPHLLSPFYCVSYMPVVNETYTVTFPSDMAVKYTIKNNENNLVTVKEDNKGNTHSYTFTASGMKAAERFGDAPASDYYEPHIIIQIASYKNSNGETIKYLGNVDDLYKWDFDFIKNLDNTNDVQLKKLADSLTNGIISETEKAKKIYNWVQQNIKYVAFEDGLEGFIPRRAAVICSRRFGDCKDMSSLLTALLQLAGINAYFTWIGTRDIPYDYTDVPLPITDNHMIATANINNQWVFLDGTDPNGIYGFPTEFIQGKQALVSIADNNYKILRVPEVEAEKNLITDSTFITLDENGIKGNSSVYYNGYFGSDISNALLYKDASETKDYVKYRMGKASNKFILDDYSIHTINPQTRQVNIHANFQVPGYSKKIGDEVYINLNLEKFFANNSIIDTSKRKISIENDFKFIITQYAILTVPENYKVSYVPKNFQYNDDVLGFTIQYTQTQNKIIAMQQWQNKTLMQQPKDFDRWNKAIKQILTEYKEQVVLQKQ